MTSAVRVVSLAAAWSSVSWPGSTYGSWASAQPTVIAPTASAAAKRAGPKRPVRDEDERGDPADGGDEHREQAVAGGEAVEELGRVATTISPPRADRAGGDARAERAGAERARPGRAARRAGRRRPGRRPRGARR